MLFTWKAIKTERYCKAESNSVENDIPCKIGKKLEKWDGQNNAKQTRFPERRMTKHKEGHSVM